MESVNPQARGALPCLSRAPPGLALHLPAATRINGSLVNEIDPTDQRQLAVTVLRTLRDRGHVAYWAGGCVRDQLLGLRPKDYDVATDATPQLIREIFGRRRTLFIGAAFGVVTVLGKKSAGQIEVTTFRSDSIYSDGRHPDSVTFSTPEHDAQRRDFTINGLFYDPLSDEVIDFVGGRDDLARGVVRAIGEARARFEEDKLRMIRAVRFVARFGFALDPATYEAMRAMAPEIRVVSIERVMQELRGILTGPNRPQAFELLHDAGLLAAMLPELDALAAAGDGRWSHTLGVLDRLEAPSFALALATLLQTLPAANVSEICRRLRMSTKDEERAAWLVGNQTALRGAAQLRWSQLQPVLTSPGSGELLSLCSALAAADGGDGQDVEYCRAALHRAPEELNPPPLVTGDDLLRQGIRQGKIYKVLLDRVRAAQLDGEVRSQAEALTLVARIVADGKVE